MVVWLDHWMVILMDDLMVVKSLENEMVVSLDP